MNAIQPCLAPVGGEPPIFDAPTFDTGIDDDISEINVERDALRAFIAERTKRIARVRLNEPGLSGNFRAYLADLDGLLSGLGDDTEELVMHADMMGERT